MFERNVTRANWRAAQAVDTRARKSDRRGSTSAWSRQARGFQASAERRRLTLALLLSLLIHALLLSLTFGGQGFGLPGFGFPWRERRIEATDLNVVLVPAQVTAAEPAGTSVKEPLQASIEQPVAGGPAPTPSVSPAPTLGRTAEAIVPKAKRTASRAKPTAEAKPSSRRRRERRDRCVSCECAVAHRRVR